MGEVLGDHRLADAVGADQDDVGALLDEAQREEAVDDLAVDGARPVPVIIRNRLEATEAAVLETCVEAAPLPLLGLEGEHPFEPRLSADFIEAGRETDEADGAETLLEVVMMAAIHRRPPYAP